jgi:hypothetical protein
MNLEKVIFGFFVMLAATLNFGFVIGDMSDPEMHNKFEFVAAVVINLIATVLKFGDRTQLGAIHLATSLVASLQLLIAGSAWILGDQNGLSAGEMASVVSLAAGAFLANIVSIVLLISETISFQRR